MEIAIDFDGTCVTHEFPRIGKDIGAVPVLKELVKNDHKLILFTMRSDRITNNQSNNNPEIKDTFGYFLTDAVNWFGENDIPLYGIQTNPRQGWTTSPKAYAHLYIDDAALGCPLIFDTSISDRPFVDWEKVREMLRSMKIIR